MRERERDRKEIEGRIYRERERWVRDREDGERWEREGREKGEKERGDREQEER